MKRPRWTENGVEFVRQNFKKIPTKEIAKILNRGEHAVTHKAKELRLTKCIKPSKIGDKFNRLEIKDLYKKQSKSTYFDTWAECICDCGNVVQAKIKDINSGRVKSCGCQKKEDIERKRLEKLEKPKKKYTYQRGPLYSKWKSMRERCYCKTSPAYKYYGEKNVKICDDWNDFRNFEKWAIENGWEPDLSIDRINPFGNYEPDNCRFVTMAIQADNKRRSIYLEIFGEKKTIRQWLKDKRCLVTRYHMVRDRLATGWNPEEAITTPPTKFEEELQAFGETKATLKEWSQDPRCQVSPSHLSRRLKNGMSLEEAITTPSKHKKHKSKKDQKVKNFNITYGQPHPSFPQSHFNF